MDSNSAFMRQITEKNLIKHLIGWLISVIGPVKSGEARKNCEIQAFLGRDLTLEHLIKQDSNSAFVR